MKSQVIMPPKKSKYKNIKITVDGILFDSKWEAKRYGILRMRQHAGEITDLKLQVAFDLAVNGISNGKYIADFTYLENGQLVVEDAKGVMTDTFKLKKKLMKSIHGIDILLTRKRDKQYRTYKNH